MESTFLGVEFTPEEYKHLIQHLQTAGKEMSLARNIARDVITRKVQKAEWIRTVQRKLYPQWQQMILEVRELLAEIRDSRLTSTSEAGSAASKG